MKTYQGVYIFCEGALPASSERRFTTWCWLKPLMSSRLFFQAKVYYYFFFKWPIIITYFSRSGSCYQLLQKRCHCQSFSNIRIWKMKPCLKNTYSIFIKGPIGSKILWHSTFYTESEKDLQSVKSKKRFSYIVH